MFLLFPFTVEAANTPSEAGDAWLKEGARTEADNIADKILDELKTSDISTSGKAKDFLKNYVKGKIKDALSAHVESAEMETILKKIQDTLKTPKGNRCQRAAVDLAYNALSVKTPRVVKGMGNVLVGTMFDVVSGGSGKAATLVGLTGKKLALEAAKKLLDEIDKRVREEIEKQKGGLEAYKANAATDGCSASVVVLWNKITGTFNFLIAGDCKCKKVKGVFMGRWSVSGTGSAVVNKNGRMRTPFVRTSKSMNAGMQIKAYCCKNEGDNMSYTAGVDPWNVKYGQDVRRQRKGPVTQPGFTPGRASGTGSSTESKAKAGVAPGSGEYKGTAGKSSVKLTPKTYTVIEIPKGPVCKGEKEGWQRKAFNAWQGIRDKVVVAEAAHAQAAELGASKVNVATAKANLDAAKAAQRKAEAAMEAADKLEEKDCSKQSSRPSSIGERSEGYARSDASSRTGNRSGSEARTGGYLGSRPARTQASVPSDTGDASDVGPETGGAIETVSVTTPPVANFDIIVTGSISFEHEVGGSSCPQNAGQASIALSNGNPVALSALSVSGDLSERLDVQISGSSIEASFNCSSDQNGEFSGNVTGTATDETNGASKSFSFSAFGFVGG